MRRIMLCLVACLGLGISLLSGGASAGAAVPTGEVVGSYAPAPDVPPPAGTTQKAAPTVFPVQSKGALAQAATATAASSSLCASGWVCIYKGDIFDGQPMSTHPMMYSWYYYGTYNFYNLTGIETTLNCQTGGARIALYTGANGTGTKAFDFGNNCISPGGQNYTPLNSIKLYMP